MEKRGQGLSTNAIILIILGVVVLVILIMGFTMGWDRIAPWISSNNVDTIVQQCSVACSTNSVYDYCSTNRTLNDGTNKIKSTCYTFSLDLDLAKYGIDECSLDCKSTTNCNEWKYEINGKSELVVVIVNGENKNLDYCKIEQIE